MKNFLQHLTESQKTYEFRIKIANIDPAEQLDRLKNALEAYGLESLSAIKRIPIKANDIDFPSLENCQIYLMDAVLTYPCNDAQVRAIIADRGNFPAANVVVVPTGHPEEAWRWNLEGNELREYVQGEAVLDKPYEDNPAGKAAGKTYSEAGSLLKELSAAKIEIAGNESADGKTTNDLPQGNESPLGSKQNKITNPVKGN
jgi:hypothetical protein